MSTNYELIGRVEADPKPGELYYHFKCPSVLYEILGIGLDTMNGTNCVIYRNTGTGELFTRQLNQFKDIILLDGKEPVRRFNKICTTL